MRAKYRLRAFPRTPWRPGWPGTRSEEHTSELQSQSNLVCRLLLEKKKKYLTMSLLQPERIIFPLLTYEQDSIAGMSQFTMVSKFHLDDSTHTMSLLHTQLVYNYLD